MINVLSLCYLYCDRSTRSYRKWSGNKTMIFSNLLIQLCYNILPCNEYFWVLISEATNHSFMNWSVSWIRTFFLNLLQLHCSLSEIADIIAWEPIFIFLDIIFRIIIPLCGLIGNTLVILTVLQGYVQLTTAHCMIASLALSNFLYALQYVIFTPFALIYGRYVQTFAFFGSWGRGCWGAPPHLKPSLLSTQEWSWTL